MRKDRIFSIINEINQEIALSNRPQRILDMALDMLSRVMKIDACWVHLLDPGNRELVLAASQGLPGGLKKELQEPGLRQSLGNHIGVVDKVVVPDLPHDEKFGSSAFAKAGFSSLVIVPLRTYHVQGILGVMSRMPKWFDRDSVSLLMVIGNLICAALDKANLSYMPANRVVESESDSGYDVKEFEKLVDLAEQYSRATRLAIKAAMLRVRGTDRESQHNIETLAENMTKVTSIGEPEPESKDMVESSAAEIAETEPAVGQGKGKNIVSGELPAEEAITGRVSEFGSPSELHIQQMKVFKKYHAGLRV